MSQLDIKLQLGALHLRVNTHFNHEIITISGENGAGKSTLLRCIAGLQVCTGQLQVCDEIWLDSSAGFSLAVAKRNIGFVWAEVVLLPWLDAEDNIKLGVAEHDQAWFHHVCESLEVLKLLKRKPAMLSTGEAQRIGLARAIYRKPKLLLLDEPFSAQAPDIRVRLRLALKALQQQLALPILLVSHDMADTHALAQQHWHMREGKLLTEVNNRQDKAADHD